MQSLALSLHPDNLHYFLFRGKPTVLVTSGEHYGAVVNLAFDYRKYLDVLAAEGLNHTRLFVGVYRELPDEWWPGNCLGPEPGQFVCPFGRSKVGGARDGGNKFDLDTWDEVFFRRLREFCGLAGERGVVIEVNLFCPHYVQQGDLKHWEISPWHPDNNINGAGDVPPMEVFGLGDAGAAQVPGSDGSQDRAGAQLIRQPVLRGVQRAVLGEGADRVEHHIADLIVAEERRLPLQHLISRNVANGSKKVEPPLGAFSIFNFHYPWPEPECVPTNYHLNKVIGCNETGFNGPTDEVYRMQAWQFMLAGGALFNHLDVSFRAGDEAGSTLLPGIDRFAGGPSLRRQILILKDFIESFDFVRMKPANSVVLDRGGAAAVYVLAEEGKQYGVYIRARMTKGRRTQAATLSRYACGLAGIRAVVDVCEGPAGKRQAVTAADGNLSIGLPEFGRDIAIRIMSMAGAC